MQSGYAQLVPYSQYYHAPLLTNPAQAATVGHAELGIQYRWSKITQYNIPAVAFLYPFFREDGLQRGGMGLQVIRQEAGPGGAYQVTGGTATFAYNVHLSRSHHLSAGLQGGFVNKRINPSGITTDQQFSFGAFDPSLPTGETLAANAATRPVVNAGFYWTWTDSSSMPKASLGIAMTAMNKPTFEFGPGSNPEQTGYIVTGEMRLLQRGRTSVLPGFRYIHDAASFANIGTRLQYDLYQKGSSIGIGAWYKTTGAAVAALQYSTAAYTLGASMDLSVKTDQQANISNAFELFMAWKWSRKRANAAPRPAAIKPVAGATTAPLQDPVALNDVKQPEETAGSRPQSEVVVTEPAVADTRPAVAVTEPNPAAGVSPAPKQPELTPEEATVLGTHLRFRLGSAELTPESVQFIEHRLAPLIKKYPDRTLLIAGHSCTLGDKAVNEKVSFDRAAAVAGILRLQGVPDRQLVIVGRDFQEPIASNDTEAGRQRNRRVAFSLRP